MLPVTGPGGQSGRGRPRRFAPTRLFARTTPILELDCTDSADPYDLLAKVLAVQHRSVVNRPGRVVEEDVGSANDRIKRAVSVLRRAEIA